MKKLMLMIFVMVFLVGTISAFEWDNVQDYDKEKREYLITNALGLGEDIARIKLTSDLNEIVPRGYQKVAEFTVENYENYTNVFNDLEFFDLKKDSERFTRDFDYKYKTTIQVPVYETVCDENDLKNGTIINTNCRQEQTGLKDQTIWQEINKEIGLVKGNITIGIFTDVKKGDRVEWIPTLFGERLTEWAVWTESLNVQLPIYWKFDESGSDTNAIDSVNGTHNLTGINFDGDEWVTGLIGNAYNGSDNDYLNLTLNNGQVEAFQGASAEYTINFWVNISTSSTSEVIMAYLQDPTANPSTDLYIFWVGGSDRLSYAVGGGSQFNSVTGWEDNTWHMFTLVKNSTSVATYGDGVLNTSEVQVGNADFNSTFAIAQAFAGANNFSHLIDEFGIWNRSLNSSDITQLFNNGIGISFPVGFPIVTLNSPVEAFNTTNQTINFNGTVTSTEGITNVTLFIDGILNETNSSGINDTNYLFTKVIADGSHNWTYESCNANGCTIETRIFTISSFIENSQTFNASSFETAQERFTINITTNGSIPSSAELIYNGTTFSSATITSIGGDDFNISRVISIPLTVETKSFFFNVTIDEAESSSITQNQIINLTNFTFCGAAPQDIPFINITFRNETLAQENVNATISSTWTYSLSALSGVNKTLTFTNASENANYLFCGIPNRTLNIQLDMDYDNSISQQRSFSLTTSISNATLTQTLFLLPTSLGLFSPFKTTNINGDTITFVSAVITRVLGGSTITVANGITDSSGFATFFLNPNVVHSATFSKTGFADNVFSFTPTADLRTVVMGGGGVISNGTIITRGTIYTISPRATTLANNTVFTFTFNVTSNLTTISLISMNITNSSNHELLFVSNAGVGNLSGTLDTGNNTKLIGFYIIETGEETISVTRIWTIFTSFIGDYSLFRQLNLTVDNNLISDFNRLLIVLSVMFAIVIFMSVGQIIETSESKIAVLLLLTWAFSIVGWLDTGLAVSTTSIGINRLGEFSNQYGIAILMTGASILFIFRRLFIRKPA